MTKKLFFFIAYILFFNYSIAETFDIRKATEAKTFTKSSYEINDTNLVDKEIANKLLENISNLNLALIEKGKEIKKKMKIEKNRNLKELKTFMPTLQIVLFLLEIEKRGKYKELDQDL